MDLKLEIYFSLQLLFEIFFINISRFMLETQTHTHTNVYTYRVPQDERSIFWKIIVLVILSNTVYMYMCPIPNGFRDRAISLYSTLYTVQTSNTSCSHRSCTEIELFHSTVHSCTLYRRATRHVLAGVAPR
jgi:hypothetical protein